MNTPSILRSASETARLLVQLCAIASILLVHGCCVGELLPGDLSIHDVRLERRRLRSGGGYSQRLRRFWHGRRGHDRGCQTIGVPLSTIRRLARYWSGEDSAEYLVEAVELAIVQIEAGEWPDYSAVSVVKYEIGRRLTIESPAEFIVP